MATKNWTTYDAAGNILDQRTVEVAPEETVRSTIDARLDQALAPLAAFVDQAKPATAAAQASAAYDGVKLLCRVVIGLIRISRWRLDSAD